MDSGPRGLLHRGAPLLVEVALPPEYVDGACDAGGQSVACVLYTRIPFRSSDVYMLLFQSVQQYNIMYMPLLLHHYQHK